MDTDGEYIKKDNKIISPITSELSVVRSGNTENWSDTGWLIFSDYNWTYFNADQSSWNMNKWRVKDNTLYISIGYGVASSSTVNTATETEIAQIPITGSGYNSSSKLVWSSLIGTGGYWAGGIKLYQESNYISLILKPHTSSYSSVAAWGATYFSVPLNSAWTFIHNGELAKCIAMRTYMGDTDSCYGIYYASLDGTEDTGEYYIAIRENDTTYEVGYYYVNEYTFETKKY